MNIQFKKGVLELCVLSILREKDCYGYELVQTISKNFTISEGTIYPLMSRLRKEMYVKTYLAESLEGPPRKYYTLTKEGLEVMNHLNQEWLSFTKAVNTIIKGSEEIE